MQKYDFKNISVALLHGCPTVKFAGYLQNAFLEEHRWGTGSVFYIICFGASNK